MAKNSIDAYGAAGKTNVLMFDPEALYLVTDPASPLYDERVNLPIDEAMVRNIQHHGVLQPIVVAKNPETGQTEVVVGRQRVKCAREANKRLVAQGFEPILVPAVVRQAKNRADLGGVMASENAIRQQETPLTSAAKMAQLLTFGKTEDDLAVLFGCTVATVKATLALLECTEAVRSAVDAGKINVSQARALAKLPPAEQREKVKALVAAGEGAKPHAKAKAQRAVLDPGSPKMRSKAEVAKARDEAIGERRAALDWVLGVA